MLFSTLVFMSRTFRGQWISVVLIFVLNLDIASSLQNRNNNVPQFDINFGNFLRDLGSMVYKMKKTNVSQHEVRSHQSTYATPSTRNYRRNQINPQKAILEDVLMMKLVSYYEDKYKLSHLEPTTTESITFSNAFTKSFLNNTSNYNIIDKNEVLNTDPKPTKQAPSDLSPNRRMQTAMSKIDEFQVPEVVVF